MRRLALAVVLACVLSGVARAGEIHTTDAAATQTTGSTVLQIVLTILSVVR
jgi:hypothetical protein